ncbi:hypothetical protein ACIBHY_52620 [Nonomuraea sp. NPDC050547]|uniref:hypothetical protein n=1 Tax=Nonomuraea sp. NPDC050547 TaxID=3364368 RepID=UPI00378FA802
MTTTAEPARRTAAAIQSRRNTSEAMLERVRGALKQIRRERARVAVAAVAVARRADVSRTSLYQNTEARALIAQAAADAGGHRKLDQAEQAAHIEASWRERALNAEAALKYAHCEIALQRTAIGGLLGKIRDLENDLPEDGVQRLVTDSTSLKQQVRQLTQQTHRLQERLTAARDNSRFLDNRIAGLEAQLADQITLDASES